MIRKANLTDIFFLLPLVQSFLAESGWKWEYSEKNSVDTLFNYVSNDDTDVLICVEGGNRFLAFATVAYDVEFHSERLGYLSKFYVMPSARGTETARQLTAAVVEWFDENNCAVDFATATANIPGEGKAFNNLLAKFGFEPCGETLTRKKPKNV